MFSAASLRRLGQCDERLQLIFSRVGRVFNCTVLEGHRSNDKQVELLSRGMTEVGPGKSLHNRLPSLAVDVAPWPIDWADIPPREQWTKDILERWMKQRARFYYLAGLVEGAALEHGVNIRWGGDWNSNHDFKDQSFDDLVHFEIRED